MGLGVIQPILVYFTGRFPSSCILSLGLIYCGIDVPHSLILPPS
jgi:hypothetical protein